MDKNECQSILSYSIVSVLWLHTKKIFLFQKLSFGTRLGILVCMLRFHLVVAVALKEFSPLAILNTLQHLTRMLHSYAVICYLK